MILPHDPNASPSPSTRGAADWVPFDPGDAPELPPTGDGTGRIVAVLAATELVGVGWAISVTIELAHAWAQERPGLVLVDTDLDRPRMHHTLRVDNATGLAEILQGESTVDQATRTVVPDRLYCVTAGNALGPAADAFDADRWARFCRAFAEAGVTVVTYVPDSAPWAPAVLDSATDVVELREQDRALGTALPRDTPVIASLGPMPVGRPPIDPTGKEPPATAPLLGFNTAADEEPTYPTDETDEEDGEPGPPPPAIDGRVEPGSTAGAGRRRGGRRSLSAGLMVATLVGAAIALTVILRPGTGVEPTSPGPEAGADLDGGEVTPPAEPRPIPPGLRFSPAVASYSDRERAEARAAELASAVPEIAWYLAPVEIDGTVYHRVLGGFSADSASGAALAARLAERLGASPEAWIVRRTDMVVDFGELATAEDAEAEAARLRALGIPAYVAGVTYSDRSTRWRVYAGGYAGVEEAAYLERTAASLGLPADVAPRLGSP